MIINVNYECSFAYKQQQQKKTLQIQAQFFY